jgi:hypothetical protein
VVTTNSAAPAWVCSASAVTTAPASSRPANSGANAGTSPGSRLKNRVRATLLAFGRPCPVSDLLGAGGRQLLAQLGLPEPWAGTTAAAVGLIDDLDAQVHACERQLRRLGADHEDVPLLMTAPGIAWVLASTTAAELGDITRFASPKKLAGSTGLCPRVDQSGRRDQRGPLAKHGPKDLRWALIEAATHAARHPSTATTTSGPGSDPAASTAPRSPASSSPASSPSHLAHAHQPGPLPPGKAPRKRFGRLTARD